MPPIIAVTFLLPLPLSNIRCLKQTAKHPVFIGPSIIHMTKEFEDYGEINLANAFVCELPDAIHLRCKIHLPENIERKLVKLSFDKDTQQNVLYKIFGRRTGDSRTKVPVDTNSAEEFDEMLNTLQTEWRLLESTQRSGELP